MKPFDIQERAFLFSTSIVNFCRRLCAGHPVTRRLGWQLLDAATSVGANVEEADAGQSKRDVVSKIAIARKEAQETVFWLRLLAATDECLRSEITPLLDEAKQLASILSSIKKSAETNSRRGEPL